MLLEEEAKMLRTRARPAHYLRGSRRRVTTKPAGQWRASGPDWPKGMVYQSDGLKPFPERGS
jgi:hypothetical protein